MPSFVQGWAGCRCAGGRVLSGCKWGGGMQRELRTRLGGGLWGSGLLLGPLPPGCRSGGSAEAARQQQQTELPFRGSRGNTACLVLCTAEQCGTLGAAWFPSRAGAGSGCLRALPPAPCSVVDVLKEQGHSL